MDKKILNFLDDRQKLWWKMSKYCFCNDVAFDIIKENDHYGCDFSGDNKVYTLFFSGDSTFFPCIWIGRENYKKNLDQLPVYVIDIENCDDSIKCKGNFKTYMTEMIRDFIKQYKKKDKYYDMAKNALIELKSFSDNLIHDDDYIIKSVD